MDINRVDKHKIDLNITLLLLLLRSPNDATRFGWWFFMKKSNWIAEHRDNRKAHADILCEVCGYFWTPNPNKWKNLNLTNYNGIPCKVLFCPACGSKKRLTLPKVKDLLEIHGHGKSRNQFKG